MPGVCCPLFHARFRVYSRRFADGGFITEWREASADSAYIHSVDLPPEYKGPELVVDGRHGLGGLVNDFRAPSSMRQRRQNIESIMHWDSASSTPQIVMVATRPIKRGDELLSSYGTDSYVPPPSFLMPSAFADRVCGRRA